MKAAFEVVRCANTADRAGRAFSLLEVLVAVSIIALLAAVLAPVLGSARAQARAVVCSSNIRQLVLANAGYAGDNDGFYVAAAEDMWNNSGLRRWHGVRDNINQPFDARRGPLAEYLKDGRVKECPDAGELVKGRGWSVNFEQGCGGYGYNMAYIGSRLWAVGYSFSDRQAYARTTNMTEIARPFETLMFADCAFYQGRRYLIEYSFAEPRYWVCNGRIWTGSQPSPSIHFRHRGRANVGWADGHIDSRPMGYYWRGNDFYAECAEQGLGWFEPVDNSLFDLQ